jgi:rfaE bifunctional protein kinase chain/domain
MGDRAMQDPEKGPLGSGGATTATPRTIADGRPRRPTVSGEARSFLRDLSARYTTAEIVRYLEPERPLRVLVIGEAIIDEYVYCETIGKSGKEPVLVARYVDTERFAGGILAVANHAASFAGAVNLVTALGDRDSCETFVREHLESSIDSTFLVMDDSPTIVKRRFVEMYPFQKIFEVYVMNDEGPAPGFRSRLSRQLEEIVPSVDLVVATDYGHGLLCPEAVEVLCDKARFLAINTQVNAANHGFNTVSKYRRADYVCVSETEIRLEARSRTRPLEEILAHLGERMGCERFLITRGQSGCSCYSPESGLVEVPAFSNRFVDRIGAGDAVLAVTALCAAQSAPIELLGLIGNAVGALAVLTVGNRARVEHQALLDQIRQLLEEGQRAREDES